MSERQKKFIRFVYEVRVLDKEGRQTIIGEYEVHDEALSEGRAWMRETGDSAEVWHIKEMRTVLLQQKVAT